MIVPYKEPRPRPTLSYLTGAETVLAEDGRELELGEAIANGWQVWAPADLLRELTRDGHGSCVLWRFQAVGWSPDPAASSWPVRALSLPAPEPRETIRELGRWRDWLCSYGAAPAGSLGGSGMSLLKATLREPLWTSAGTVPPIRYTLGGRQQDGPGARPAIFTGRILHCDKRAAYAYALGRVRYGGQWARFDYSRAIRRLAERNPDVPVYARAAVDVPELETGPLPVRPRSPLSAAETLFWRLAQDAYPTGRTVQGCWTWPELMQAERAGCRIRRVLDVWVHGAADDSRPFAPWLEAIEDGRGLGGFAGTLAKVTGNATWGQFAISRGRKLVATRDATRKVRMRGGNPSQRAFDLAEWIAGSVRAELHAGMVAAGRELVVAHTDGLWTTGPPVEGWRVKVQAAEVRVFDPQCLSYRVSSRGPWRYVVAGVLDPAPYFERRWREATCA